MVSAIQEQRDSKEQQTSLVPDFATDDVDSNLGHHKINHPRRRKSATLWS